MDPRNAATRDPDPDAIEFVRFCYRRRRVGWPELYDEMCAVAGRGLFRGYGADDLAGIGIGFSLFDMPALAALAAGSSPRSRPSAGRSPSIITADDVGRPDRRSPAREPRRPPVDSPGVADHAADPMSGPSTSRSAWPGAAGA